MQINHNHCRAGSQRPEDRRTYSIKALSVLLLTKENELYDLLSVVLEMTVSPADTTLYVNLSVFYIILSLRPS